MQIECPHCKAMVEFDGNIVFNEDNLALVFHQCSSCGEYFNAYFKIRFIGCTTYDCNLYPAEGETEESMLAAGVEIFD